MAHDDEKTETTTHRGRHLAADSDTVETTDGEYTSTDGVSHTDGDEQGSYVDTSSHEESSTEKGSYVDSQSAGPDSDAEGEYTDRDE
ncbi:hypothetical protein [Rathayibacter sp. VKM Ac-2760]|uniref:hypothetical protein n=1 Tax=Rathayibacter sp. VKM Ac-2760 TaxID=2609253 RepID=UPI0013184C52|nr:hypothetical protein [Rathayibacter sp. VKM Ac-2760]QHC59970.1 hypothetical protein GSU72_16505 [Rathayibacter sp. VKM Ac-2760]